LSQEELQVFEALVTPFGTQHGLPVAVENVTGPQAISKLKHEKGQVDLVIFDINEARVKLVRDNLLEDLSGVRELRPSSMYPVMMQYLDVDEKRFFLPFRLNVRLVFVNRKKLAELDPSAARPETWADVLDVAKRWHARDGKPRVVVTGGDAEAPLLLLELILSAGGDPCRVLHPQSQAAIQLLRELWQYVSPTSSDVDWQTASSFLLAEDVYVARNWAFALSLIHDAGREQDFEIYVGWRWAKDLKPSYLLGGDVLALPKRARHKRLALKLIRFLTSKKTQAELVKTLSWPPMRFDSRGVLEAWQQRYQDDIHRALRDAKPAPTYWWPEMQPLYTELFATLVALSPQDDLEQVLVGFQGKLDQLRIPACQ
jgi:ABC-type glycerol-3-phosphate transport system substrate-binding protein